MKKNICAYLKHNYKSMRMTSYYSTSYKQFSFKRIKKIKSTNNDKNVLSKQTDKNKNQLTAELNNTNETNDATNISEEITIHDKQRTSISSSNSTLKKPLQSARFNEVNLQMLPLDLYKHLFGPSEPHTLNSEELLKIKEDFKQFNINTNNSTPLPDVDLKLPQLQGANLEQHFYNIAAEQIKPYTQIIDSLQNEIPQMPEKWLFKEGWTRYSSEGIESVNYPLEDAFIFDVEVCIKEGFHPTMATAVSSKAWYSWVSHDLIHGITENWKNLVNDKDFIPNPRYTLDKLIPMESEPSENGKELSKFHKKPKIIIGHNVSYDRARIKEQYWLNRTGMRFLDTMSLHICVSGVSTYQRNVLKSQKTKSNEEEQEGRDREEWHNNVSLNNLSDVHKLYCGSTINKAARDEFVTGTNLTVRDKFDELMMYCASDVLSTHNIFKKLYPLFKERFQHPVTLAGMLEMGTAYLPVNSNWNRYIKRSERTFNFLNFSTKRRLTKRANEAVQLMHNNKYKEDLWMWDQDWNIKRLSSISPDTKRGKELLQKAKEERLKEREEKLQNMLKKGIPFKEHPLYEKFGYLFDLKALLPKRKPIKPGYPEWYRKLCPKPEDKKEPFWFEPENLSYASRVTPKLLNLTWENYPLHYIQGHGWGFLVPYNNDLNIKTDIPIKQLLEKCPIPKSFNSNVEMEYTMDAFHKDIQNQLHKQEFWRNKNNKNKENPTFYKGSGVWCNVDIDKCCWFFKLPHKNGMSFNVGNPLSRDFLEKLTDNVLAGPDNFVNEILRASRQVSYWRNNRDRINSQAVVWLDDDAIPTKEKLKKGMSYGAIIPQVVSAGTLTRRAVEATWMTATNANMERIGSELRSMIQAPPGYNIVGADVDSEELWIASIIGDSHKAKIHGATPFGWMTLVGNKANGTDMHSMTARESGMSRDHAKVINYARIYGAGQKFAESLLKQFNPSISDTEASRKARKMFELTKGKKVFYLNSDYDNPELLNKPYTQYEIYKIAKIFGLPVRTIFNKGHWIGGSESAMFNRLEEIANNVAPVTPFLNSRLSRALESNETANEKFLPTKINWVVQSGAVDFLHLMLVCMRWLMRDNVRFCLSFHDDVRYLVPSEYKYKTALAMHITNLMTRSFCALRLGMKDLPMSVAFFASVEVDTILRKNTTDDCKTPSNAYGLKVSYDIPPGESLNIWQAIEKTGGNLDPEKDVLKS